MYCKSCGSENDDVARFCRDCGRAITGSSPSIERVASPDSGDTPDVVEAPTKANTWVWVAGGAGLVAVLLFAGLLVLGLEAVSEIGDSSPETDREALAALFHATDGPNWLENDNWLTDVPLSEWTGVTTDEDGRVTELDLAANELSGQIPPELGNLDRLRKLDLTAERTVTTLSGRVRITIGGDSPSFSSQVKQAGKQLAESAESTIRRNHLSGCIPISLREQLDLNASDLGGLPFCDETSPPTGEVARAGAATTAPTAGLKATSSGPANVRYIYRNRHGQVVYSGFAESVRVSWEPVEGADYYEVYARAWMFDDRGPLCDPAYFCRMVITNLKKTTHEFDSPANLISGSDGINRHWVTACNRSGCSDPVLAVVEDSSPSTTAPTASPSPEQSETPTESDTSRRSFEASTPSGYTQVTLTDLGRVWGTPEKFTTDSSLSAVAYMLLGSVRGCNFASEELRRSSIVYVKLKRLGRLPTYASEEVCGRTSSAWDTGWDGLRISRLRIFDESSPTSVKEYVYDPVNGQYVESPASGGAN